MNVHHLELFYYVARHGGIMPAVRNIPYGIQQPAVSSQMAQLEESLGATLFQRRPFCLTAEGEKLYQFIQPFFSGLPALSLELQGGQARHLRFGASTIVLRDHLPGLFHAIRKKFPQLKLSLREGYPADLEDLLRNDQVDLVVTLIERATPTGLQAKVLLELAPVLLVERSSPIKSAEDLWRLDKIEETLICLPEQEALCKRFQEKLAARKIDWFPGIVASSIELIETYVAGGLGVGLSIAVPKKSLPVNVRAVPLPGFPSMVIGAMWRGRATPLIDLTLAELQKRAKSL